MQEGLLEPQVGVIVWTIVVVLVALVAAILILRLILGRRAPTLAASRETETLRADVHVLELALQESEIRARQSAERADTAERALRAHGEEGSQDIRAPRSRLDAE